MNQGGNVTLRCPKSDTGSVTWVRDDGSALSGRTAVQQNLLIITNSTARDAGLYICTKTEAEGGTSVHKVHLIIQIIVEVRMSLRILNWNYTEQYKNSSTPEYKTFADNFKKQMDLLYKDFKEYIGVEILEIFNGSIGVRYRINLKVSIREKDETPTKTRVAVTQRVIDKAKTGRVENLLVDSSPNGVQSDSPPPPPENVSLVEVSKNGAEMAWDLPANHDYYFIKGFFIEYWIFSSTSKKKTGSFKGQRFKLTALEPETSYVARVIGVNKHGRGEESSNIDIITKEDALLDWEIALIVTFCVIILVIIIAVIIFLWIRKKKRQQEKNEILGRVFSMRQLEKETEGVEKGAPNLKSYRNLMFKFSENKCKEFPRNDLVLQHELGAGEFGVVYKGQYVDGGKIRECAVKTLKGSVSAEKSRELYKELAIMTEVGYHPNLINLIGACTDDDSLYIIVEFACNGALIEHLQKHRKQPDDSAFDLNYGNRMSIALDVAKGMSHLAEKWCIHRDLAARNVLLAENFVAKVADFGLSRDIYETGEYEKTTAGKLPTRWMALESLELRKFTLESEVWSFGVLLWEIETRGLVPYGAAMDYNELLENLKRGYRLEQPQTTPAELYGLMKTCWSSNPKKRPTFPQICGTLQTMLGDTQGVKDASYSQNVDC